MHLPDIISFMPCRVETLRLGVLDGVIEPTLSTTMRYVNKFLKTFFMNIVSVGAELRG